VNVIAVLIKMESPQCHFFLDKLLAPSEAKSISRPKGSTASEAKCLKSKVEAATADKAVRKNDYAKAYLMKLLKSLC
jgi:hypothetical protein